MYFVGQHIYNCSRLIGVCKLAVREERESAAGTICVDTVKKIKRIETI